MHLISYSGSTSNSLEAEWPCHPTLAQTTPHKLLFAPSFGSYSKQGRVELDLFAPQQLATTYHSPFPATEVPRSPCSPRKRAKKLVAMQKVPGLLCNKFLHGVPARACTVNSGELRIPYPVPYPVPVCVTGNLWLVKFNVFIL